MSKKNTFLNYTIDQMSDFGVVTYKNMFGGIGLFCEGYMFALIAEDVLYLKVDDSNRPDFEQIGSKPFKPYATSNMVMQYYNVPVDLLEDKERLTEWCKKAFTVAELAKNKKRK